METLACWMCSMREDTKGGLFNCGCPKGSEHKCYYSHRMSDQTWMAYHASILKGVFQMELFVSNAPPLSERACER
jgi:hypothetical protein